MHKKQNIKHKTTPTKSKKPPFFEPNHAPTAHCISIKSPKQKHFQKEDVFSKNIVQLKSAFEAEKTPKMKLEVQPIYKPDVENSEVAIDKAKDSSKKQVKEEVIPSIKKAPAQKIVIYGKKRVKTPILLLLKLLLFGGKSLVTSIAELEEEEGIENREKLTLWQRILRSFQQMFKRT